MDIRMTRINLVPPQELADQHLFAEFREIKMVPASLARSLEAGRTRYARLYGNTTNPVDVNAYARTHVWQRIPTEFTLGKGHVSFFYNKGQYLIDRYDQLRCELTRRGVNFNVDALLDPSNIYTYHPVFCCTYTPTEAALALIRARIAEKIAMKPKWYRWTSTA